MENHSLVLSSAAKQCSAGALPIKAILLSRGRLVAAAAGIEILDRFFDRFAGFTGALLNATN